MIRPFEWMIASRYLRAKKAESFVSVTSVFSFLGIMLGVATLIVVLAVMNGFRAELFSRILGLNGPMQVYSSSAGSTIQDPWDLAKTLEQETTVRQAVPVLEKQALLSTGGRSSGVVIRGMVPEDMQSMPMLSDALIQGRWTDLETEGIAIGAPLARSLGVSLGDSLTLLSPEGKASPFGTLPRSGSFTVRGIFDVGIHEYNVSFLFMQMESAQRFFRAQGATQIALFLPGPAMENIDQMREKVAPHIGPMLRLSDWRQTNASLAEALTVERNVMFLILTLIIVIAAFNIISSMIMLVKDKQADIAILRTMGAPRASILKIFIMTGSSIGIAGTAAGAAIGIGFAANVENIRAWLNAQFNLDLFPPEIYFLSKLPARMDTQETVLVCLLALTLSFLATLYPAWRAARTDPVEALRYA